MNYLRAWGTDPIAAANLEECFRLRNSADLVIMDQDLLENGTWETSDWIRSPSTGLVLISSIRQRASRPELNGGAMVERIGKPVRPSLLRQALARIRRQAGVAPVEQPPPATGKGSQGAGLHPRVLVVEDNLVNQRVATRCLEKLGCAAEVASDGMEALRKFSAADYDVIFMDVNLPRMDGFEITREIRLLEASSRRVPIIAMTANAMSGDRERCLAAGMDDYISKPISLGDLRRALGEVRRHRRA